MKEAALMQAKAQKTALKKQLLKEKMQKIELQSECKRVWLEVKRVHTDLGRLNISRNTVSHIT